VNLPSDDQPSGAGLVPGTLADALASLGPRVPTNPAAVALEFYLAATNEEGPDVDTLRQLVTPESLRDWGDFAWVPDAIGDRGITTRGQQSAQYDWVWYVGLPAPVSDEVMMSDGDTLLAGSNLIVSLIRQPNGMWLVHGLGDYWLPDGPRRE
jgi:hypothetical protein